LVLLVVQGVAGFARNGPVELLQRHRYEEAISLWEKDLKSSRQNEAGMRALKGQAIAFARLGSLYENLAEFSLAIMDDYYQQLIEVNSSPLLSLYLGQIDFYRGQADSAKYWLAQVKGKGSPGMQDMAEVYLQNLARGEANPSDTDALWQALDLKRANSSAVGKLRAATPRSRRCHLSILSRDKEPNRLALEKALDLVVKDGQEPEAIQDADKNSQINFYDPDLMGALARGYFALAKATNMELAGLEKRHPELAAKFGTPLALAESAMRLGQWSEAMGYLVGEKSTDAELMKATILGRGKKEKEALAILEDLAGKAGRDAAMKRNIAEVYYFCRLNPDVGLKLIREALQETNGTSYYRVYGGLLLAKGRGDEAVQQYAKGYKIEFRNRIDQIDPEYMSDYSFALYKNNKLRYEEIVETLYHLQKEFPPSRQMHYCMQGVSAGLARSFESQRIFRKGG